jgi:hypothetical protein
MPALTFGFEPEPGTLKLSRYGDFVSEIISNEGNWPAGAQFEFRFLPDNSTTWIIWPATVDGGTAAWVVDKVDVATMLDSGASEYRLFYVEGTYDLEWSKGPIRDVT